MNWKLLFFFFNT